MVKLIKYISAFIIILITIFSFNRIVIADSGWDSDYDSGGSDWSSSDSDWGSSSSLDDDDDWGSSSSSTSSSSYYSTQKSNAITDFLDAILIIIGSFSFFFFICSFIIKITNYFKLNNSLDYYKSDVKSELKILKEMYPNIDFDLLKEKVYKNFVDVQNAWMNFDYDILSKLCSDELFNEYKSELEVLKFKMEKNIMSDFRLVYFRYKDFKLENNIYIFQVIMTVNFYDYVVDSNNKVIRGHKFKKLTNAYRLTYTYNDNSNIICPNCGAKVNNNKCEYCGSLIKNTLEGIILVEKERIR